MENLIRQINDFLEENITLRLKDFILVEILTENPKFCEKINFKEKINFFGKDKEMVRIKT